MKLRFLLGPAGTGKTYTCLDEITSELVAGGCSHASGPLFFLVPEQATFQLERALLEHRPGLDAIARARVTSFKRLAFLALEHSGPLTRAYLSELGKLLALQIALERERPALGAFGRAADTEGFLEALSATLSEVRSHAHRAEALLHAVQHIDQKDATGSPLQRKVEDVARVGAACDEVLSGRFHDPDEALDLAVAAIASSGLAKGAKVWIDGFAGFTPQEYTLLSSLMGVCAEMTIALCLDPDELGGDGIDVWDEGSEEALFHPTRQTLIRLRDLARAAGVTDLSWTGLGRRRRFQDSPFLESLERALVAETEKTLPAGAAVLVVEAADRRSEARAVASEVQRLVRCEGYRYNQIAVILRNMEPYRSELETTFTAWGIPFFLDHKPSAIHHPLVTLINAALDLAETGMRTETLMRYLKTDLVPVARRDVDALENEALVRGFDGEDWCADLCWEGSDRDAARRVALRDLETFLGRVRTLSQSGRKAPAERYLEALWHLLDDLKVAEQLEAWSSDAAASGSPMEAREHQQVWDGVVALLDQIHTVAGAHLVRQDEFAGSVNAGLKRMNLGRVPPELDQVLVGAVERSRQPDLACVMLMGMNDGQFPAVPAEDPVFSDEDRALLQEAGIELGSGSRRRLFHEQYLLYIALTRASRRLVLTYSRVGASGRPLRPSPMITWLHARVPDLTVRKLSSGQADAGFPEQPGSLEPWLARGFRRIMDGEAPRATHQARLMAGYQWLYDHRASKAAQGALGCAPLQALVYANPSVPLSSEQATAIFGEPLTVSASRIEEYAACAFRHFAGYGLKLSERAEPLLDLAALGSMAHGVMSAFVRRLARERRDWSDLSRSESDEIVASCVQDEASRRYGDLSARRAVNRYVIRRLEQTLQAVVWAHGAHCRQGQFRPVAVEVGFGPDAPLPALGLHTPNGRQATVQGRIDRIDEATDGARLWMRVIDYKSSRRSFQLERVIYGIDLQLLLYLHAVGAGREADGRKPAPAGCLYLPVFDPLISSEGPPPDEDESWQKELKAAGLIVDDDGVPRLMDEVSEGYSNLLPVQFKKDGTLGAKSAVVSRSRLQRVMEFVEGQAGRLVDEIVSGNTDVAPYELSKVTPCSFCSFKSVCQFDLAVQARGYRRLRPLEDDEAWRIIEGEGGDERVG